MRLGRIQTGMSSYRSPNISFRAFTNLKMNSDRSDFIFTRHELLSCRSETAPFSYKTKNESQTGSINSMFLRMAPPVLLFLSKNRNTATNNISKTFVVNET